MGSVAAFCCTGLVECPEEHSVAEHPTFSNPTIKEALCEIHFALPEDVQWHSELYGAFFKHIQPEFPSLEPVTSAGLQVQLTSGRVGFLQPQSRMRYKHVSRNLLLQLSESILTVNVLPKYPGWTQMQADIAQAWMWARDVLKPTGITRIGLRYINFVPKASQEEAPGDWFAPNDYVARAVLASPAGLLSRAEVHDTPLRRVVVTLGEAVEAEAPMFVLDVDCVEEAEKGEYLDLTPVLSSLHETAWQVFSGFMTPRLRRFLDGGAP